MSTGEPTVAQAVALYAEFFKSHPNAVHPDWKGDWPTTADITNPANYYEHPREHAHRLGAHRLIDVPGGVLHVVYMYKGNNTAPSLPLQVFARAGPAGNTRDEKTRNDDWGVFFNKRRRFEHPHLHVSGPSIDLPTCVNFPRWIGRRLSPAKTIKSHYNSFFRIDSIPPFTTAESDRAARSWTQLPVAPDPRGPYHMPPDADEKTRRVDLDDRAAGAPSSPDVTYILLTLSDGYKIIFRARIHQVDDVWRSWRPPMTVHTRLYDLVRDSTAMIQANPSVYWDAKHGIIRHDTPPSHSLSRGLTYRKHQIYTAHQSNLNTTTLA